MLGSDGGKKFRQAGLDGPREDPSAILGDPDDVVIEVAATGSGPADSHGMVLVQMFWERKSPRGRTCPLLRHRAPRGGAKFISPPEGRESSFASFYRAVSAQQNA